MRSRKKRQLDLPNLLSVLPRQASVSLASSLILGLIAQISSHIIPDPFIRSVVIGCLILGILLSIVLPQIVRCIDRHYAKAARKKLKMQGEITHHLLHLLRDTCVQTMPAVPAYMPPPVTSRKAAMPHPNLELKRAEIILLLDYVAELFQASVPPGTKVWTCLRDRRADGCYHTFARAGFFNPNRAADSRPMKKDEGTIALLKESCKSGICVWITGSNKGPALWKPQENDKYREDRSVMLGAIMTKSWDAEVTRWSNHRLAWVVGVCADSEDAFDETHIPLMRACVDMFSVLANVLLRCENEPIKLPSHARHRN